VLPQKIAKEQMLTGVHYSLSLPFMLRDTRKHEALPVRAP
jgi:gamma-glutamylcysteine synthetase